MARGGWPSFLRTQCGFRSLMTLSWTRLCKKFPLYLLEWVLRCFHLLLPRGIFALLRDRRFFHSGSDTRSRDSIPRAVGSESFDICICPPSPGRILVHAPDNVLLTSQASGPSPWRPPPGKCKPRYTEASFSFCSIGRGRLRLRQHHVSRGSALSDGKGPWTPRLLAGSALVRKANSGQWGAMLAEREEPGWWEQQG